jgi:hypothetical protein
MLSGTLATPPLVATKSKRGRSASRPWLVTQDPSGDFLGRSFRAFDLFGSHENYWPEGTVFENKRTSERKVWRMGQYMSGQQVAV